MTTIGFIGQGFIGKHLADDFADRGYSVVRYSLEEPYLANRELIASCEIVFVAVPTPTTPTGFSCAAVEAVLPLIGPGKIVVIKSTVLPGTTAKLQAKFPAITILHSPEFLREKSAREDTKSPAQTIIGMPIDNAHYQAASQAVLAVLPSSPYTLVCGAAEAELIKYGGNCFLAMKVIYMNLLYDAATATGANYSLIAEAMQADNRIGTSHMQVIDHSGHPGSTPGRGAGGHCFPKDLAALRAWYSSSDAKDDEGVAWLTSLENKNNALLRASFKDLDLLDGIYGEEQS